MRGVVMRGLLGIIGGMFVAVSGAMSAEDVAPPNIVLIVADDLGYAELGCYGQEKIRTPNVDRLAREGMRFTQHYSGNAVCAPSRCVLMTGMHPGHAIVRTNREIKPEGQHPLPPESVTVAELLKEQGYTTGAFGKWGLGPPGSSGDPLHQGFDRFFGYNCQRVAHNYYPTYLWSNDERVELKNEAFSPYQKLPEGADPHDPASYRGTHGVEYAPDLIAEQARQFVRDNRDRPFFLYYPTIVPHLALQVPEDSLEEYASAFPEDPPYVGGHGYLPHRTPRAAYAAMVTRMDAQVGRLMDLVEELGLTERTIFIFSSDNGPAYDQLGGTDSDFFESNGPLRGHKGSLYEGGIRVPCVVRWKGRIEAGSISDRVTGFEDWAPTLLDLTGAAKAIPAEMDGISFAPTLLGKSQPPRPFLYREFPSYGGQQSVRIGDWKGIRQNLAPRGKKDKPDLDIELYNLAEDVGETTDVSAEHPAVVAQMEELMRSQHTPSEAFPLPALDNLR
ncbi:MAG: arylsulfatase [Planctomycetes bacterium]|nr:arylsulfatase [Planctomycetota bacterium]